ncbi:hypothetical protein HDU83_003387 [Entophlyctis luteolus]|nr:hypothetical protein HDU83_003387 [Entophlyctis luteolus]
MSSVVDVKAVALLWRSDSTAPYASLSTRADKQNWILKHMMRPMSTVQLLSVREFKALLVESKLNTQDPYFRILDLSTKKNYFDWDSGFMQMVPSMMGDSSSKPTALNSSSVATEHHLDESNLLFRITPDTRIYSCSEKYRVSIVVDVSASMRVVDSSFDELNRVSPQIYVTILAKAGASMGYRPDISPRAHDYISKHPVHVLLQDVQVTQNNLFSVTEILYDRMNQYENEIISLKHLDNEMNETASSLLNVSKVSTNYPIQLNSLEHGLLALRLLPRDCSPVLIVLSDGVSMSPMKGEFLYRDVCRRLAKEIVNVTIIQVGSSFGFNPGVNFGFVPDNEALRFLARACFGKFIYSSDCNYLEPIARRADRETATDSSTSNPNFYHRYILIRTTNLSKSKNLKAISVGDERPVDTPRVRLVDVNLRVSETTDVETLRRESLFPWHPHSLPPMIDEILYGHKDYNVDSRDLSSLIKCRLLEGFELKSIHIGSNASNINKAARKSSVNRGLDQKISKGEKVEIILLRPWLPNVTIQYTIKAKFILDSGDSNKSFLSSVVSDKPLRIELNIRTTRTFALAFVNVENSDAKSDSLVKLHNYMRILTRGIQESDGLLNLLVSFKSSLQSLPRADNSEDGLNATGFGILRIVYETDWLVSLRMLFYNVPLEGRCHMGDQLCQVVQSIQFTSNNSGQKSDLLYSPICIYITLPEIITSGGNTGMLSKSESNIPQLSLLDLSLYLLYFSRLESGYLLISHLPDSVTMYREISLTKPVLDDTNESADKYRKVVCGLQFIILIDRAQRTIVTEIWAEPIIEGSGLSPINFSETNVDELFKEEHESHAQSIMENDSRLFNQLYTFDSIRSLGKTQSVLAGNIDDPAAPVVEEINQPGVFCRIMRTDFFLESVLQNSDFYCVTFTPPEISPEDAIHSNSENLSSKRMQDGSGSSLNPINSKELIERVDETSVSTHLCESKAVNSVCDVPLVDVKSLASSSQMRIVLNRFFHAALVSVSDGELDIQVRNSKLPRIGYTSVPGKSEKPVTVGTSELDPNFMEHITNVVATYFGHLNIFTPSFNDCACFVKIRNPEQFLVAFVPKLNSVAIDKVHFLVTVVQCNRSRIHGNDSGRTNLALNGFEECKDKGKSKNFRWDFQGSENVSSLNDGTLLFSGDTRNIQNSVDDNLNSSESVDYADMFLVSISNAFSISHCQSTYAALLQNINVSAKDLDKALASCSEISVDIDLTNFLNVLTLRHKTMAFDDCKYSRALDDKRLILDDAEGGCKAAFYSTVTALNQILEDEVINCLLDRPFAPKFLSFTSEFISKCLNNRHQNNGHFMERVGMASAVYDFPLVFVKELPQTSMIINEFRKSRPPDLAVSIDHIHDSFVISGDAQWAADRYKHDKLPEFLDGIHKSETQNYSNDEEISYAGVATASIKLRLRLCEKNWIRLSFAKSVFRIWQFSCFTPRQEQIALLAWVVESVQESCERVNKFLLLQQLHADLRATKYLIARLPFDASSDEEDSDDESQQLEMFHPNQFACACVFSRQFPLHWRVKPYSALSALSSDSFSIFAITNRKNMFVVEADNSVWYFKLSVREIEIEGLPNDISSPYLDDAGEPSKDPGSPLLSRFRAPNTSAHRECSLILEFFGIDVPSANITSKFEAIIESKLMSMTQIEISVHIARNVASVDKSAKLYQADVDFVLPPTRMPNCRQYFKIPENLSSHLKFFSHLRQAMLTNLNPLNSNEVVSALDRFYSNSYGLRTSERSQSDKIHDSFSSGLALLYSCLNPRAASKLETSIGVGIAAVCICILGEDRKVVSNLIHEQPVEASNCNELYRILQESPHELRISGYDSCLHDSSKFFVAVDVWLHGPINGEALMDFVFKGFVDSIMEFITEVLIDVSLKSLSSRPLTDLVMPNVLEATMAIHLQRNQKINPSFRDFFDRLLHHLTISASLKSSFVEELNSPINLFNRAVDEFALEVRELLIELSPSLAPIMVSKERNMFGSVYLEVFEPKSIGSNGGEGELREVLVVAGISVLDDIFRQTFHSSLPTGRLDEISQSSLQIDSKSSSGSRLMPVRLKSRQLSNSSNSALGSNSPKGFLLMSIRSDHISVFTHSIPKSLQEDFFNYILRMLSWNNINTQYSGISHPGQPKNPPKMPKNTPTSDYSSSFRGIGGLGAAMKHIEAHMGMNESDISNASHESNQYADADVLQKNAVAFLDAYIRKIFLNGSESFGGVSMPQSMARPGHAQARHYEEPSPSTNFSPADLAAVLRSVRLHYVKFPIFFTAGVSVQSHERDESRIQILQNWFRDFVSKLMWEYCNYLTSQKGFEKLKESSKPKIANDWASNPKYRISLKIDIDVEPVYLVKFMEGSMFILQVGVEGICAAVNLYMLKQPLTAKINPDGEVSEKQFRNDCALNKGSLHLHSFMYDFHIRYFQRMLDESKSSPVDIVTAMRTFEKENNSRSVFARSWMLSGQCFVDIQNMPPTLFQYILKNPSLYGFNPVYFQSTPTACFMTSDSPKFSKSRIGDTKILQYKYSIIIYLEIPSAFVSGHQFPSSNSSTGTQGGLNLKYFLLVADQKEKFPLSDEVQTPSFVNYDPLNVYIADTCYLRDIVKFAERRIHGLIEDAVRHYDRDSLWRQVYGKTYPSGLNVAGNESSGVYEWTKLFLEKISTTSRTLVQVDPSLLNIFGNSALPWRELIKFLRSRFGTTIMREIFEHPKSGRNHLLFFNPGNSDFLIHLVYWTVDEFGLPLVANSEKIDNIGSKGDEILRKASTDSNGSQKRQEIDWLPLKTRLQALRELGVHLAKPGEIQMKENMCTVTK